MMGLVVVTCILIMVNKFYVMMTRKTGEKIIFQIINLVVKKVEKNQNMIGMKYLMF